MQMYPIYPADGQTDDWMDWQTAGQGGHITPRQWFHLLGGGKNNVE